MEMRRQAALSDGLQIVKEDVVVGRFSQELFGSCQGKTRRDSWCPLPANGRGYCWLHDPLPRPMSPYALLDAIARRPFVPRVIRRPAAVSAR